MQGPFTLRVAVSSCRVPPLPATDSESLADAGRQQFDRRGWLDQMRTQVKQVNGNIAGLAQPEATNFFNVRFRFENAAIHSLVPIKPTDAIRRLPRYRLAQLSGTLARGEREWSAGVKRVNFSSHRMTVGHVYTRKQLADEFGITDATLNTGVFQPKGSSSVWLFVTEKKSPDRTQYEDRLEGDILHWQGQTEGRTDDLIIEHQTRGLELLLFYRREKYEHPEAGFRYEGRFRYLDHHGTRPTSFVLRRVDDALEQTAAELEKTDPFDPKNVEDARARIRAQIVRRQGQGPFRQAVLRAYGRRCAITGCDVEEALEAAHIFPYRGEKTNHVTNGVLLRADLHTLFDLGMITVDPETVKAVIAGSLRRTAYGEFHGKLLQLPVDEASRPSREALEWHWRDSGFGVPEGKRATRARRLGEDLIG